ncbi:MAG: DUF5752 family protein [Nanoarchaeota archaeon]
MRRKISTVEANRILARTPEQVSFWLCTNKKLYSLRELSATLSAISDEVFRYHVNRDKNDFENWIRDIIQDRELAREISRIKTKETLNRKITDRVEQLTRILKSAKPKKTVKKRAKKKSGKKKAQKKSAKKKRIKKKKR